MDVDVLINAKWVIPIVPRRTVYTDYSVAISDGKILDILPTCEALEKYKGRVKHRVERPHHAIMPGLINSHTHVPMTALRGFADDIPLQKWLMDHIIPAESNWLSEQFVSECSHVAFAEMIKSGTTAFFDMYFFCGEIAEAAHHAGLRGTVGCTVMKSVIPNIVNSIEEYYEPDLINEYLDHPRVSVTLTPHAPYSVTDDQFRRVVDVVTEKNLPFAVHIHETAHEVEESVRLYGMRPIERLNKLGVINSNLVAVHCTQMESDEIKLFAERGVSVAHCPESNCKLASGISPVADMLDAGVNVCLGTDGVAANNEVDLFGEMKTAAFIGKVKAMRADAVPAHTILEMVTINGAKALKREHQIGSLEIGKEADMISINLETLYTQPVYDPVGAIVYSVGRESVEDVLVAGKFLLQKKVLTTIDEERAIFISKKWGKRIFDSLYNKSITSIKID